MSNVVRSRQQFAANWSSWSSDTGVFKRAWIECVYVRTSNSAAVVYWLSVQCACDCESARTVCVRTCWLDIQFWSICLPPVAAIALLTVAYTFISFRLAWLCLAFMPLLRGKLQHFMLVQFSVVTIVCLTMFFIALLHTHDYSKERTACRLERKRMILNDCRWWIGK